MKYGIFLLICSALFATSRTDDLRVVVGKNFLEPQSGPLLNMMAMEVIAETEKNLDVEKLIEQFRKRLSEESVLTKFFEPYKDRFSDAEVHELRKIHENPVWQKYAQECMPIIQAQLQTVKELLKELAANEIEVQEAAAVADAEILEVTQENFNEIAESTKPVILDINAPWCKPCKMMEPILKELSEKYKDTIQFAKIDFDSQTDLAHKYNVTSLPTILFIKPGEETPSMKSVGFLSKKDLEAKISEFLKES